MKTRIILISVLMLAIQIAQAQKFQGKAVYKMHMKFNIKIKCNPELQKQIEDAMKKKATKTYILNFNNKESIYEQEQELAAPTTGSSTVTISISDQAVLYKNVFDNQFVEQKNFMGKIFLISDSLEVPKWELKNEQKTIGKYACNKAVWTRYRKTSKFNAETNKFEPTTDTLITTAWYTPEIPVNNGPAKLWALPGLILEAQMGKTTILCSELNINVKEKTDIEKPKKGKKVTQKEYDKITKKKIEEMNKRNKNNRKSGDKSGISITITK